MEFNYLPDEIISEIFLKLPVKCLVRFTLVCKQWKAMIKSSNFIHTHLITAIKANNSQRDRTPLVLHHGFTVHEKRDYSKPTKEHIFSLHYDNHVFDEHVKIDYSIDRMLGNSDCGRYRVTGVCNGVICLSGDDKWSNFGSNILWNPSIRKSVILPPATITCRSFGYRYEALGFGFDASTNDYKVVRVFRIENIGDCDRSPKSYAQIYSLATNSWKKLGAVAYSCFAASWMSNIFFNEAVHWVVMRDDDDRSFFILTFDVASEAFDKIMLPEAARQEPFLVSVAVKGDSLALFCSYLPRNGNTVIDIWVMKEYGVQESWSKMMTLDPHIMLHKGLRFSTSCEDVVVFFQQKVRMYGDDLATLDLASGEIKESCRDKCLLSVNHYEESLVLLDVDNAICYN